VTWLARHGAWKKLFLMTHILQYRAARARQDSLADNPKNSGWDCLSRDFSVLWSQHGSAARAAEEEAERTLLWNGSDSSNSSYFFF